MEQKQKIILIERDLKPAGLSVPTKGASNRDPAAATVRPSGYTTLNSAGTDLLLETIKLNNYVGDSVALTAGVDEETGVVVLYVADPGTPDSVICRLPRSRHTAIFHLQGVFEAYPSLKVVSRTFCPATIAKDSKERHGLALAFKGAHAASRRLHTSKAGESETTSD